LRELKKECILKSNVSPSINKQQNTIEFNIHNQTAEQVSQVGRFSPWAEDDLLLTPGFRAYGKLLFRICLQGNIVVSF